MESSGKVDGKVAPGLHTGGVRGFQEPFMMVPSEKLPSVSLLTCHYLPKYSFV